MVSQSSAQPAREIMLKHEDVMRNSYNTYFDKLSLSTCRYAVKAGRMRCVEKPRVSLMEGALKYYGKDSRSMIIVSEPARDKGIGVLYYSYYDPDKDNDNWLYMPALGKVKRLISTNEDDDSGNFLGSEFTTEDMQIRKIDYYTYKILGEEICDDRPAWVIESTTKPERINKTRYSKIISWVDKETFMFLKQNFFDHNGKQFKQRSSKEYEKIDGVWVARRIIMNNLSKRRVSVMKLISIAYNVALTDDFLTQRSFTDFAYRERNAAEFRKKWN